MRCVGGAAEQPTVKLPGAVGWGLTPVLHGAVSSYLSGAHYLDTAQCGATIVGRLSPGFQFCFLLHQRRDGAFRSTPPALGLGAQIGAPRRGIQVAGAAGALENTR